MAKNTICLWYNKDAEAAARFYTETFPESAMGPVHRAPGDYPGGKKGDVLTVEFVVAGVPCIGLNGGPVFEHTEAFSFQIATDDQQETDRYWNAIVSGRRLYQERIGNGMTAFTASAVAGDGKVCLASEEGDVYVLEAGPAFKVLAKNVMGEICMASSANSAGVIYFRTAGHLVAVAAPKQDVARVVSRRPSRARGGTT